MTDIKIPPADESALSKSELDAGNGTSSIILDNNAAISKRITRKLDLRLAPVLGLMYLLAFLDRTNIANAKLQGFEKDLHMPSNGYNTALWVFYVPFVILEVPSNLILSWRRIQPYAWISGTMFCLGCVSMCQGLTQSAAGLYACRTIMGALEAGIAPGAAFLMGQYYRRVEFPPRYAAFVCCALLGNAFSAFLAYAIAHMDGVSGLEGWRWIFILEGILTAVVCGLSYFVIPGLPETPGNFLTEEERTYLLDRLAAERSHMSRTAGHEGGWLKLIFDWRVWLATAIYFCADMSVASNVAFTPTILSQLGWLNSNANLHTIPIYMVGIVCCMASAYIMAHTNYRSPVIFVGASMCIIGWAFQRAQIYPVGVRYFGLFLIACGANLQLPNLISWLHSNMRGRREAAIASAIMLGVGNSANFVSSNVFIATEAPKYPTGFTTGLVLAVVGWLLNFVYVGALKWQNRKFDKRDAKGEPVEEGLAREFRYRM